MAPCTARAFAFASLIEPAAAHLKRKHGNSGPARSAGVAPPARSDLPLARCGATPGARLCSRIGASENSARL